MQVMDKSIENRLKRIILSTLQDNSSRILFNEWLSISEPSKYVGVSYNTFTKFQTMGLKICQIDGIKRVSRKEIDSFLENHSF